MLPLSSWVMRRPWCFVFPNKSVSNVSLHYFSQICFQDMRPALPPTHPPEIWIWTSARECVVLARHPDARLCSKPARRVDQNAALKGSCYAEFTSTMLPDGIACVWPVKTPSLTFACSVSTQFWESAMWWFVPFIDVNIWMSRVSCHESTLKMWFRAQSFWMPADCQSAICLCARH